MNEPGNIDRGEPLPPGSVHSQPLTPGAVETMKVPDDITTDPELLRHLLLRSLSRGMLISVEGAERYLSAHEEHVRAAAVGRQ